MANGFGYTFSPNARNRIREQNGERGAPSGSRDLGRALQVLSLRLPRVSGGAPIAPDELLRSMGGPGPVGIPEPPPTLTSPNVPRSISTPMLPTEPISTPSAGSGSGSGSVGIPPLMGGSSAAGGSGSGGALQTLVGGALGGGSAAPSSPYVAPKVPSSPKTPVPRKRKPPSGKPSVRGAIPTGGSSPSSGGTPRIIPGIDTVGNSRGGLPQATEFPYEPEMTEASGIPSLASASKPRWAEKYEMGPEMFNNFLL